MILAMGKYKSYKQFENERAAKTFLYPYVCLKCRKSFKKTYREELRICSSCSDVLVRLNSNFFAPKESDKKQWKKVEYLIDHGFLFQHVYQNKWGGSYVAYPETLAEAKEFVIKYKHWAIKCDT